MAMMTTSRPKVYVLAQHLRGIEIHDYRICWAKELAGIKDAVREMREYLRTMHPGKTHGIRMVPASYRVSKGTPLVWSETFDLTEGKSCYYVLHQWPFDELKDA